MTFTTLFYRKNQEATKGQQFNIFKILTIQLHFTNKYKMILP